MPFIVIYDANVLYPSTLRDVLIRVAMAGMVQAKWTDTILDETFRNLKANRPDLEPAALDRTRNLMNASVRDALVTGFEPLIGALDLPDPNDRHVLAAAIRAKAQVIVTANLRDFPDSFLSAWDVEAKHPDDFLLDQFHIDALSLGEFNRSSQHLAMVEVSDGSSTASSRPCGASEVEVAGASEVPARDRDGVLGRDREGSSSRGGGECRRRVRAGRGPLVPPRWRNATVRSQAAYGQVPDVW